jgi:hypothetical protein
MSDLYKALSDKATLMGDKNMCVPIAYAVAMGIGWQETYDLHREGGRRKGRGMVPVDYKDRKGFIPLWERKGLILGKALSAAPKTTKTLLADRRLRSGTWMVLCRAHVLCLRDGVVHDWAGTRQLRVHAVRPVQTGPVRELPSLSDLADHMFPHLAPAQEPAIVQPVRNQQHYVQVYSNIYRSRLTGAILLGNKVLQRVKVAKLQGQHLGERKLVVTTTKDTTFTVVQADRDCYFVEGPGCPPSGFAVKGWADGIELIDQLEM